MNPDPVVFDIGAINIDDRAVLMALMQANLLGTLPAPDQDGEFMGNPTTLCCQTEGCTQPICDNTFVIYKGIVDGKFGLPIECWHQTVAIQAQAHGQSVADYLAQAETERQAELKVLDAQGADIVKLISQGKFVDAHKMVNHRGDKYPELYDHVCRLATNACHDKFQQYVKYLEEGLDELDEIMDLVETLEFAKARAAAKASGNPFVPGWTEEAIATALQQAMSAPLTNNIRM